MHPELLWSFELTLFYTRHELHKILLQADGTQGPQNNGTHVLGPKRRMRVLFYYSALVLVDQAVVLVLPSIDILSKPK